MIKKCKERREREREKKKKRERERERERERFRRIESLYIYNRLLTKYLR